MTVPRNHTKKIAEIRQRATLCRVYSLDNDFVGRDIPAERAWDALYSYDFAKLIEHADHLCIHVHGNLWFELKEDKR